MRKIPLLILGIFVLLAIYTNRTMIERGIHDSLYQSPCDTPIEYSIGKIDDRFGVSQGEVIEEAGEAANIWNKAGEKNLLSYDPNSKFTINLVYDVRQRLNSQVNNLNNQLDQENSSLKEKINAYEKKAADFKNKLDALNAEIDKWNRQGGAPHDVYARLVEEQKTLQGEANELNAEAKSLNQSTDQYNVDVRTLNREVKTFNTVLKYKPEEGLYTENGGDKKIEIYFYNSKKDFVHTLTHEMGHALALAHVEDQTSIMFPQTNDVIVPSSYDLSELSSVCQKRNVIFTLTERKIRAIRQLLGLQN